MLEAASVLLLDVPREVAARDLFDAVGAVLPRLNRSEDGWDDKLELRPDAEVPLAHVLPPVPVCPPARDAGSRLVPCHPSRNKDYNLSYLIVTLCRDSF